MMPPGAGRFGLRETKAVNTLFVELKNALVRKSLHLATIVSRAGGLVEECSRERIDHSCPGLW
jgi:hypothetical protein